MYRPPRPLVDSPTDLTPAQKLAAAVLKQAVDDVMGSRGLRRRACAMLNTDSLRAWCGVAGLDHRCFLAAVRRRFRLPPSDPL
jgi:hypothetical protein